MIHLPKIQSDIVQMFGTFLISTRIPNEQHEFICVDKPAGLKQRRGQQVTFFQKHCDWLTQKAAV